MCVRVCATVSGPAVLRPRSPSGQRDPDTHTRAHTHTHPQAHTRICTHTCTQRRMHSHMLLGAGKSTLSNYLHGCKMQKVKTNKLKREERAKVKCSLSSLIYSALLYRMNQIFLVLSEGVRMLTQRKRQLIRFVLHVSRMPSPHK